MLTVYCYDIAAARVRTRAADLLEREAVRVQESVFEAWLTRRGSERLFERVAALLDEADSLRMYAIGHAGRERCRAFGGAPVAEEGDFWIV